MKDINKQATYKVEEPRTGSVNFVSLGEVLEYTAHRAEAQLVKGGSVDIDMQPLSIKRLVEDLEEAKLIRGLSRATVNINPDRDAFAVIESYTIITLDEYTLKLIS